MKIFLFILTSFIVTDYCHGQMTMEELKTAKWNYLNDGIQYININDVQINPKDSIRFIVRGVIKPGVTMFFDNYDEVQPTLDSFLTPILNQKVPESGQGYLKLNVGWLLKPLILTAKIILRDSYDTTKLKRDINTLRNMFGVVDVTYISKEKAKQEYLSNGNEDWSNILSENPLPASIDVSFDFKKFTKEKYEKINQDVLVAIPDALDISFPGNLFNKYEKTFYIIEYQRH